MRVVLYTEGSLESRATGASTPAPGDRLGEHQLGAAHVLVRRILVHAANVVASDIEFLAPLRVRGRIAVGSDLLDEKNLRRLLTWPSHAVAPDLAVVLVDGDGDSTRRARLTTAIEGLSARIAIGVCEHEFESWLASDLTAVREVSGRDVDQLAEPHNVEPGHAKHWFRSILGGATEATSRCALAERCDLERLGRQRSFELFAKALARRGE